MRARVVLVEDQPEIRQLIRMTLDFGDFELGEAVDADAGWSLIKKQLPDLVLLDVMMPRKNGFDVCQEVRADAALAGVRILMLTAKGRDTEVAKGLALGADAYMTKPFSTKELVSKVRELLDAGARQG